MVAKVASACIARSGVVEIGVGTTDVARVTLSARCAAWHAWSAGIQITVKVLTCETGLGFTSSLEFVRPAMAFWALALAGANSVVALDVEDSTTSRALVALATSVASSASVEGSRAWLARLCASLVVFTCCAIDCWRVEGIPEVLKCWRDVSLEGRDFNL